jgi:ABC-type phosphate transport system substrate-binding protein
MRMFSKCLAGATTVAAVFALTASPALADPPSGTTPAANSAVGVGANTDQFLFDQVSANWNKTTPGKKAPFYSWDATNPTTGAIGDQIETKNDCTTIARPDGTGQGVSTLEDNTTDPGESPYFCVDYARASSLPSSPPTCSSGGYCYVELAGDAVTWAYDDTGTFDGPKSLTTAQLASIYECNTTNWDKVGGKNDPIDAYLPNTSSGTRSFFLSAIGVSTPGACVSDLPTTADPGGTLEENEGDNPVFNNEAAIFIYSVGDYIGQSRSGSCGTEADCFADPSSCTPTASQNQFGCDLTGYLGLGEINKIKPTAGSGSTLKINTDFPITFQRNLYDVVRFDPDSTNGDGIPGPDAVTGKDNGGVNLEQLFSAATQTVPGYFCKQEVGVIKAYGFLPTWSLGTCGTIENP